MGDVADIMGVKKPAAESLSEVTKILNAASSGTAGRGALSIPGSARQAATPTGGSSSSSAAAPSKAPPGTAREVYQLLDGAARAEAWAAYEAERTRAAARERVVGDRPTVADFVGKKKSKKAKKRDKEKASRRGWRLVPFQHPARTDALELSHWVRAKDVGKPYKFAKLNVPVPVPDAAAVRSALGRAPQAGGSGGGGDDSWTDDETVALFDTLATVGIRWPVVVDRHRTWAAEHGRPERRVEHLKARYYEVRRAVAQAAAAPAAAEAAEQPTVGAKRSAGVAQLDADDFTYPLAAELRRRDALDALLRRTPDDVAREAELTSGFARIQTNFKRMHAMKPRILRACDDILHKCMPKVEIGSKRDDPTGSEGDGGVEMLEDVTAQAEALVGKSNAKNARELARKKKKKGVAGPIMGAGLTMPRGSERKAMKVEAALDELGIQHRPLEDSLLMPYFKYVCAGIVSLVDIQRIRSQKEYQAAVLTAHAAKVKAQVERVRQAVEAQKET